jgi:hypothetical protein
LGSGEQETLQMEAAEPRFAFEAAWMRLKSAEAEGAGPAGGEADLQRPPFVILVRGDATPQ